MTTADDRIAKTSNAASDGTAAPLISVITVVFNAVATIKTTIESLTDQTYQNIQFVVIDGGSTDGTLDVLRQVADRIDYQSSEKDNGIYDAMNKGIAAARGDWILFLNSGDTFASPDVLQTVFKNGAPSDIDVLHGNVVVKGSGKVLRSPSRIGRRYFYFETLCHQSIFARRETFERIGAFDPSYRVIADREWLLRLASARGRFTQINVDVCVWNPVGFSSANINTWRLEVATFQSKHFTRMERALLPWVMRVNYLWQELSRLVRGRAERE